MAAASVPSALLADILDRKDYHLGLWFKKADFQLRLKSNGYIVRFITGEDIVLDIIDGVLTGRITWDPLRVDNINTFMHHQIRGCISNLIRREEKNLLLVEDSEICGETLTEILEQQDLQEFRNNLLEMLEEDAEAYFVFLQTCEGYTAAEIAADLGMSISGISNAKKRIKTTGRRIMKKG